MALQRVVCLRTDRLGETLLTLPAALSVKAAAPQASLTLLVHPGLEALCRSVNGIDEVWGLQLSGGRSWWVDSVRLAGRLRRGRFDLAVVFNPTRAAHLAVWLAGIPRRVGYDHKWDWALTGRLPDRKGLGQRHEVEWNLDLVRCAGMAVSQAPPLAFALEPEQAEVARLLAQAGVAADRPLVAVHPWTSNPRKQWPPDRMAACVAALGRHHETAIALIGGGEERQSADRLAVAGATVVDLVGRLALPQTAALLQRAAVLLSNDSGPVHLAAAVGTPVVALFGTSDPATGPVRWGPWGPGHTVIWKPSMEAIMVDEVVEAVKPYVA